MNKKSMMFIGVLIVLIANLFFVVPILFSGGNYYLTLHPAGTDQHRAGYFIPVDEFKDTGSISKDVCIYEQSNALYPRVHAGYALYGFIHRAINNPFYSHFVGNLLFMSIALIIVVLLFKREMHPIYGLIYGAIFWGPLYDIETLRRYAVAVFRFVTVGSTDLLYSSLIQVYGFTTKITVARVFVYIYIFLFAYVYLSSVPRRIRMFFLSILLGTSIYIHLFPAMILYTTMGLICLYYIFKKRSEWRDIAITILSSLIIVIPFAIHSMKVVATSNSLEIAYKYVIATGYQFFFPSAFFSIILVLCAAILYKSRCSVPWKVFFTAIILSAFVASNMQIFLPVPLSNNIVNIVYDIIVPLTIIVIFKDYLKKEVAKKYVVAFLAVAVGSFLLLNGLASSSLIGRAAINPEFSQALEWMRAHNTVRDVYIADSSLQEEILLWTPVRLYYCDSYKTSISYDELTQRVIEGQRLLMKDDQSILKEVNKITSRPYTKASFFGKLVSSPIFGMAQEEEFTQVIETKKGARTKYLKMSTAHPTYKLDYILIRKGVDSFPITGTVVFENAKFAIISVTHTKNSFER